MSRRIFGFDTLLLFPSIFETVSTAVNYILRKKEEGKECLENVFYKTDAQNNAVGCSWAAVTRCNLLMALEAALSPFTWSISSLKGLRLDPVLPFYLFQFNPLNPKIKIWIFLLLPLFISYRSNGEKLIKYQANSSCMIMSVILMTPLLYKALIFQGEIWCWSLLGLKGLRGASFLTVESNIIIEIKLVHLLTINEWGWVSYEELWRSRRSPRSP